MPVLRAQLKDAKAPVDSRKLALESLLRAKDPEVPVLLKALLDDPALRAEAIRALAQFDDAETPRTLLKMYGGLSDAEKLDAVRTLVARAGFARELVAAIEGGQVNKQLLTAEIVRQIRQFKDEAINAKLDKLWGAVRETPEQKKKEIERFKNVYAAGGSTPGDPRSGRAAFNRVCAQCHTLFESGAKIGPDLTGSNRANLDYILENVVDPNAVIPNEYQATILQTKGGQMAMGPIKQQDAQSVTLATLTGPMTVARGDIASLEQSPVSMMPEGLLNALTEQEVRDLIYYLRSPAQVPLPNEPVSAPPKP
jgi:putative heme-binding domain-containing protein